MALDRIESSGKEKPPSEERIQELMEILGRSFDLSTEIAGLGLGEAVEERIRSLRPADPPEWGSEGDIAQVAKMQAKPLDFYYRPHLFPNMNPSLRLGHLLQFDLLPRQLPATSPLDIAAVLESYCHLSGDLLGWRAEGNELFLWMADVSGHGVRAGLAAAVLYFLVEATEGGGRPALFAQRINERILAARNSSDREALFATAFWLHLGADGRGVYASSGHPPMLLRRRSGEIERLAATGMPVGLLPDREFEQIEIRLEPGDRLCLFTDGLLEATDPEGEEFGLERIEELLRTHSGTASEATRQIYHEINAHKVTHLLDDDLTFLVAEPARGGSSEAGGMRGPDEARSSGEDHEQAKTDHGESR